MRIFEKLIIFHPSRRIIIPPPFLDHLTCPKHMEDNRKRLTYTQTQYIIAIIWHRIIREASVLTFYPRGSRSPPPQAEQGFQTPGMKGLNTTLPGIGKFLYIYFNSKGSIRGKELSCKQCSVRQICSKCDK